MSFIFGGIKIYQEQIFYRTKFSVFFVNIKPFKKYHVLGSPAFDCVKISDLSDYDFQQFMLDVNYISKVFEYHLKRPITMGIQNGPEAGQTVSHVHVHIMPADNNDKQIEDHNRKPQTDTEMAEEAEYYKQLIKDYNTNNLNSNTNY